MADVSKILNTGLAIITNLVSGLGGTVPKYIGWGTGTTPPIVTNTGLETPSPNENRAGTNNPTREQTVVANDTMRVVQTIMCLVAPKAITEVALFDASTNGNCFCRGTFDVINVSVNDGIEFTIDTIFEQKTT